MRRLFEMLPGPTAAKVAEMVVILVVVLIALGFVFEWAGSLLDSGGVIGNSPG